MKMLDPENGPGTGYRNGISESGLALETLEIPFLYPNPLEIPSPGGRF